MFLFLSLFAAPLCQLTIVGRHLGHGLLQLLLDGGGGLLIRSSGPELLLCVLDARLGCRVYTGGILGDLLLKH